MSLLIGIGGGTGSGKTTIATRIKESFRDARVVVIPQDAYYKDRSHLSPEERARINYDHPEAFDTELLLKHLNELKLGNPIEMPIYDFKTHTRLPQTIHVEPGEVIILEGILVLYDQRVRELLDIKIYVDTPDDIRFIRRLVRDVKERGRTVESVINQYLGTVRPMHLEFVEPTKSFADVIIPEGGHNDVAINMFISMIETHLRNKSHPKLPIFK